MLKQIVKNKCVKNHQLSNIGKIQNKHFGHTIVEILTKVLLNRKFSPKSGQFKFITKICN